VTDNLTIMSAVVAELLSSKLLIAVAHLLVAAFDTFYLIIAELDNACTLRTMEIETGNLDTSLEIPVRVTIHCATQRCRLWVPDCSH